jgi:L-malate glycosyltransferase
VQLSGKRGAPRVRTLAAATGGRLAVVPSGLRVLHLDSARDWRSGQRQVYLLAATMRDAGHEPLVVAPPESPLVHRARARGLAAASVPMRGEWDLAAARRLRALIRTWRPDVVHAHDGRTHAIALAALVGHGEIPLVVTRRSPFRPRHLALRYGQRVARFIASSHNVREALVRAGTDPTRVEVVYAGIPAPVVERPRDWRRECRWPADAVLCGIVGTVAAESTPPVLSAIAGHLPAGVRRRARLLLLGGPGVGRCQVGGIDAFRAGFVDDVQAAIAGVDVLWHPSAAEGVGATLLDAMALGVPPVAFAIGPLPELIQDERSGLLAPASDLPAFAAAAARLVEDDALRAALAAAGRERSRAFDAARMTDLTVRVYQDVLRHA